MTSTEKPDPITTADVALGNVAEGDLVSVRTTMRPDVELRVTTAEAQDLDAQGLLVQDKSTAPKREN